MWPFRSKKPAEDTTERLERLEKAFKQLEIEWTDTYDKFRRLHMRVAKQAQRVEQAPEREGSLPTEGEAPTADGTGVISLSERQSRIQQQILARRNRVGR